MTEEQLNESIIKNKIQGICQDCIYLDKIIPIINQMLKEEYIKGLEQGKLDKEMEKQQLINWLEDKIEETTPNIKINYYDENKFRKMQYVNNSNIIMKPAHIVYQEVLDFVRGDKEWKF